MQQPASPSLRLVGALLGVYGMVLLAAIHDGWPLLLRMLPPGSRYNPAGALLLTAIGLSLMLWRPWPAGRWARGLLRVRQALQGFALLLPAWHLLLYGIEASHYLLAGGAQLAQPAGATLAPNSALAFLCAGLCLVWADRPGARRMFAFACSALTVTVLALAALAGHLLNLDALYRLGGLNRMLIPTAVGLGVVAGGLWLLHDELTLPGARALGEHHARIRRRAVGLLSLVAISAGIGGFAVLRNTVEASVSSNLLLMARTFAAMFTNTIENRLWLPRSAALLPAVADALAALPRGAGPADAARQQLAGVGEQLRASDIAGVRFLNAARAVVAESGRFDGDAALSIASLDIPGPMKAELRWNGAYVLRTESPVLRRAEIIGHVVTEQRLRAIDQVLAERRSSGAGADAVICSRSADAAGAGADAACAPSRFQPRPFSVPIRAGQGRRVDLPMMRALAGQHGVAMVDDLRGVPVVAAYAPLGGLGFGLVLKTDVDTVYAPLRQRLQWLGGVLVLLVALGAWALGARVRPLLNAVEREQRRIQVILENSQDAFIAIDERGCVTDWNRAAQQTFGWSAEEAIGQPLATLIFPASQRERVSRGLAEFASTGVAFFINQRVEIKAIDRQGREVPLEVSAAALAGEAGQAGDADGECVGYRAAAFTRDISERLLAQQQLSESEKRLRDITDNLPVLIAYIDRHERFRFVNATFRHWLGLEPAAILGKTMAEAVGPALYAERKGQLERALQGHRVSFDVESEAHGVHRSLHTVYVPDVDARGEVHGLYGLTTDVTTLKKTERRLTELATHDSLTGLANRHLFNQKVPEALARAQRSGMAIAVMFLDIDHFKSINDRWGHAAGDAVLKEFARRLAQAVRMTDVVARLAGDEFVVILEGLAEPQEAQAVAAKILVDIARSFETPEGLLDVSTSIGIAFQRSDEQQQRPDQLLAHADHALYAAKAAGRNCYRVWDEAAGPPSTPL